MSNKFELPKDKELAKQVLESQDQLTNKIVDQGWLGKIWGSSQSVPNNICALSVVILLSLGVFYTGLILNLPKDQIGLPIKDFWAIITPIITLALGYLFGEKFKK